MEDFAALLNDVELVDVEVLEDVDLAAEPMDFYAVDFLGLVEAEVDAEIVLREVAAAAAEFVGLDEGLGGVGFVHRGDDELLPMPERLDLTPTSLILIQLRLRVESQRRSWGRC